MNKGKIITVNGLVDPVDIKSVLMHEHLYIDFYDWEKECLHEEERYPDKKSLSVLKKEAVPNLKKCLEYGCNAYVDTTFAPHRAYPTLYKEISDLTGIHIILCTGFYRETPLNTYWVKREEDTAWFFIKKAPIEELADYMINEIESGIHNTEIRAGAIKVASTCEKLTNAEYKAFKAAALAQKKTGVHITTHCNSLNHTETAQLKLFEEEGVDLNRVVIGHTANHLMDKDYRQACIKWMKRGALFLPTNLGIYENDPKGHRWKKLIEAIHEVFDKGCGNKILFGLDSSFVHKKGGFIRADYIPSPAFLHMFTYTLPAFREMGLTAEEEKAIMQDNPNIVLPVR